MSVTVIGNKLQVEVLADESTKTQLNDIQQEVSDLEERLEERVDTIIAGTVEGVSGAEIVDARQGELTLGANITKVKSQVADNAQQLPLKVDKVEGKGLSTNDYTTIEKGEVAKIVNKADITYVDTKVTAVASGSPKGTYATLSDLQTAFPTGNTNIYIVTADDNWYYWSGSAWVAGGVYQSSMAINNLQTELTQHKLDYASLTGVNSGAVTPSKTSFFKVGKNLFDKNAVTLDHFVNDINGTLSSSSSSYNASDYIPVKPNTMYIATEIYHGAYYDSNKVYISSLSYPIVPPLNAAYMRLSVAKEDMETYQVEEGSIETTYESFRYLIDENYIKIELPVNSVSGAMTDFVAIGKNLFNKENAINGYYVSDTGGNILANPVYNVSDFIEILPNTNYAINQSFRYAFYDSNKTFISGNIGAMLFTTPINAKYIRCSNQNNDTFQLEQGIIQTAYEPYGYKFTKELPNTSNYFPVEIKLPSKIYALVGQELNIYFDNIINDKDTNYSFDVNCNIGGQFENYYRVTPTASGTYTITIRVFKDNLELANATSSIIVTNTTVGNAVNKKVLVIGDSTTANGICTQKLLDNFTLDPMNITLLGTQGTTPNLHEGRSGWTINQYYTDTQSPFVFNGMFDFSQYISTNSIAVPDYVIINLGINDTFNYIDDTTLNAQIGTMLTQYQSIIDNIKTYNANIKIGLAVTIPPNYSQDALGKAYDTGQTRWRYKRNNYLWTKALISEFYGSESSNVYLVPINTNLDTRYNMGIEQIQVNARNEKLIDSPLANGGVHPSTSGYWQIADIYWYWLKSFEV